MFVHAPNYPCVVAVAVSGAVNTAGTKRHSLMENRGAWGWREDICEAELLDESGRLGWLIRTRHWHFAGSVGSVLAIVRRLRVGRVYFLHEPFRLRNSTLTAFGDVDF